MDKNEHFLGGVALNYNTQNTHLMGSIVQLYRHDLESMACLEKSKFISTLAFLPLFLFLYIERESKETNLTTTV